MKLSVFETSALSSPLRRKSWQILNQRLGVWSSIANICAIGSMLGLVLVSLYGLIVGNMYLCLESLFIAFIPYLVWSSYRRVGTLDLFAPDLGFPLAYILYLTAGSIALPIQTQFGLVLPWIVWLYYIIGLVAYLAGARMLRPPSPAIAAHGVQRRFWPAKQFLLVTLGLLAIGAIARAVTIGSSGLEIFHANDETARVVGAKGIFAVLSLCLAPAFLCMLLYVLAKKPRGLLRIALFVCMALIGLNAIATTNRTALLSVALAAVVVVHYVWKRLSFIAFIGIGLLVVVFASALGTFRDVTKWGDLHIRELEKQGFTRQTYWLFNGYEAVRLPTETFYMTVQHFPDLDPYTFGKTSLAEFGAFLPGPTLEPSRVIKEKLRLDFVGFGAAATILAPLWADGGIIGVIVGMFLIGLGSRALHQMVLKSPNYTWILVYAWFMQSTLKAIKDDVIPDLSLLFVIAIFPCINLLSSTSFQFLKNRSQQ